MDEGSIKVKNITGWLLIILLLMSFVSAGELLAGPPQTIEGIPLFPGVVRDNAAEERLKELNEGYAEDVIDRFYSEITRIYTVNTVPEEVCRYYIKELNAIKGAVEDPGPLEPGLVVGPWYEMEYFEDDAFEDQYEYDMLIYNGKWVKSCLSKRETWDNGKWILGTGFEWNIILENGDMGRYSIYVEDDSFDFYNKTFQERTRITISVIIEKSEETYYEDLDQETDEMIMDKIMELRNNPPTEKMLGVPIYPDAVFDVENSAGMSLDDEYQLFIYLSDDPIEEVLAFYEEVLQKKATPAGMGYLIPLKGQLPVTEESIAIDPNFMFGGEAKTVFTIQKHFECQ